MFGCVPEGVREQWGQVLRDAVDVSWASDTATHQNSTKTHQNTTYVKVAQTDVDSKATVMDMLRDLEVKLPREIERREQLAQRCTDDARNYKSRGRKKDAMRVLNERKELEAEIDQYQGHLSNVKRGARALESNVISTEVYEALEVTTRKLRESLKKMDPGKVRDMAVELEGVLEEGREVSAELDKPLVDTGKMVDQEELEREFDEIDLGESKVVVAPVSVPSQPKVVQHLESSDESESEDELEKLKRDLVAN
jgi:hypothetical protein